MSKGLDIEASENEETLMTSSRYGNLPSIMNVHAQWTKWKSMNLCGMDAKDRLCLIEMQSGYSGRAPLGMRTGFLLRDGMSINDPLLAAAGDESRGLHAFNPDGIVFLPPLDPHSKSDAMDTELIRAKTGTNNDIAFHFSIEVGEAEKREDFVWRKVKKGDGQGRKNGFKLVQISVNQQSSSSSPEDGDTVAFLEWVVTWPSLTHAFTLELVRGRSEEFGRRWALMVTVTAMRLYTLHVKGKTSKTMVDMGKRPSES
ncbi:hypothetical protein MYU51_013871 [Penicillium brevicompactum]|uniref:uncharacterized protein n=1 Tax=Penicillium brevicompactum TaxID=5074 RepID=UPI0025421B01|nr:uncharacterized protein N7506_011789 [Penicillium brevicompactum]KAJ5319085.1 hypothetical protein N7506_011789 [Penicillium brevicompactum]